MTLSDQDLFEFIQQRELISIRRSEIDDRSLQAIPLRFSSSLLLVQYVYDFQIDGLLVIRREDITSLECRATDRFQRTLIESMGLIDIIDPSLAPDVSSFATLLSSRIPLSIVILEDELADPQAFWIGRIVDVGPDAVHLHEFTGAARWESTLTRISLSEITCCQLNTRYANAYAGYFEVHAPPVVPGTES